MQCSTRRLINKPRIYHYEQKTSKSFCNNTFKFLLTDFFTFCYVLSNVPFLFHYFFVYGEIALWPISYVAKMLSAKMLAIEPPRAPGKADTPLLANLPPLTCPSNSIQERTPGTCPALRLQIRMRKSGRCRNVSPLCC